MNKICGILSEEQINQLAIETEFVKRRTKFSAVKFVRMLLFDHLQEALPSLQQHALSIETDDGLSISKQGINKRFNDRSLLFIQKLFEKILNSQLTTEALSSHLSSYFRSVRVLDSTEFKLPDYFAEDIPGYSKSNAAACAAIQLEYDILSRKIECLSLGNAKESDKTFADKKMGNINKGDLLLRDLGYYSVDSYGKIENCEAFYISRLKCQTGIYQKTDEGFEQLSWQKLMKKIQESGTEYFDQWAYIGEKQKHRVRLLAWILPENEQQKRLQRKKRKNGTIRQQDLIWSKLNVFITNIAEELLNAQQAYHLYKVRWQIEWMFKIWKSILNIDAARKMKTCRLKCYLYSKLIWVLICWDITSLVESVNRPHTDRLISQYKCFAMLKNRIKELKNILFTSSEQLKLWLIPVLKTLTIYGWKESKKGRVKLEELLQLK